jgi:hypothetical protein
MQIGARFPGASLERPKFLNFLLARAKQGELQAGELRADLLHLSGKTVAHMDTELRFLSNEARQSAWVWGGAGVAASLAGAVAGTWWGGSWLWGAAGALVGLPAAVPAALKVRESENHLYTDWQMRGYAKAAVGEQ